MTVAPAPEAPAVVAPVTVAPVTVAPVAVSASVAPTPCGDTSVDCSQLSDDFSRTSGDQSGLTPSPGYARVAPSPMDGSEGALGMGNSGGACDAGDFGSVFDDVAIPEGVNVVPFVTFPSLGHSSVMDA
jgi:hypothetical protein